jgi:hypothetical protein
MFPVIFHPKLLTNLDRRSTRMTNEPRRDFFNSHICIKKTTSNLMFIDKLEFLM